MKFTQIIAIDRTGLVDDAITRLGQYSTNKPIIHRDIPDSEADVLSRIADADCILVSWNTRIDRRVIEGCPNLKYIGLCCSLYDEASSNVDIAAARERGITVVGIRDYGDEGLVEFVISESIRLCKGLGDYQWREEPVELNGKSLGIIGLGTTGRLLADRAMGFNMRVNYFNRSRKPDAELAGVGYLPLPDLLTTSDIISLHLPKNANVLGRQEFDLLGAGKILINTSLGLVFDKSAFVDWVQHPRNFAIFDADGIGTCADEFLIHQGVIISNKVSGWTLEARERLSGKVLNNLVEFLEEDESKNHPCQ